MTPDRVQRDRNGVGILNGALPIAGLLLQGQRALEQRERDVRVTVGALQAPEAGQRPREFVLVADFL